MRRLRAQGKAGADTHGTLKLVMMRTVKVCAKRRKLIIRLGIGEDGGGKQFIARRRVRPEHSLVDGGGEVRENGKYSPDEEVKFHAYRAV